MDICNKTEMCVNDCIWLLLSKHHVVQEILIP